MTETTGTSLLLEQLFNPTLAPLMIPFLTGISRFQYFIGCSLFNFVFSKVAEEADTTIVTVLLQETPGWHAPSVGIHLAHHGSVK